MLLLEGLVQLFPGLAGVDLSAAVLPQVTDLLSLLDRFGHDGHGLGPNFDHVKVLELRVLVERAIGEILDGPCNAPAVEKALQKRRHWAKALLELARRGDDVTVITTNYDLVLEQAIYEGLADEGFVPRLAQLAAEVDYGFNWRMPDYGDEPIAPRPAKPTLRFFKLHGSLNWLRCAVCGFIYINPMGAIYHQSYRRDRDVHNTCTCGARPLGNVLVTPSIVRDVRDFNLLSIWNSALESLRMAEQWVFVGYSLPSEDISIRSLLLRACAASRVGKDNPTVVAYLYGSGDNSNSPELGRYKALIPKLEVKWGGVLQHIDDLARATAVERQPEGERGTSGTAAPVSAPPSVLGGVAPGEATSSAAKTQEIS